VTQERFSQIVDDPELLRRITYEELKTLALAYPYAHNLRSLLAIKARQIGHVNAIENLATASAYSLDRTQLFLMVAPQVIVPQQVLAPEEVLELKPIETVKRELEALAPIAREERNFETAKAIEAPEPAESAPSMVYNPDFSTQAAFPTPTEAIPTPPTPLVKQTFSDWVNKFHPPVLDITQRPAPAAKPARPMAEEVEESVKSQGIAQQLAERSVAENQDVISETLAKLYAKQGYRDKSAQMYARLSLLFPEKSAYFAAEIDKLKK
jgi:hypothetical protein